MKKKRKKKRADEPRQVICEEMEPENAFCPPYRFRFVSGKRQKGDAFILGISEFIAQNDYLCDIQRGGEYMEGFRAAIAAGALYRDSRGKEKR